MKNHAFEFRTSFDDGDQIFARCDVESTCFWTKSKSIDNGVDNVCYKFEGIKTSGLYELVETDRYYDMKYKIFAFCPLMSVAYESELFFILSM